MSLIEEALESAYWACACKAVSMKDRLNIKAGIAALRSGELVVVDGERLKDYIETHNPIVLGVARAELFFRGELAYLQRKDEDQCSPS